jgi:hypothetical protein
MTRCAGALAATIGIDAGYQIAGGYHHQAIAVCSINNVLCTIVFYELNAWHGLNSHHI